MKKIMLSVLSLILLLSAAFFVSGCKKKHTHSFTEQTVKDEYLSTAADCTNKAKYYYSCSCGEKGAATFEYGSPLGHSLSEWKIQKEATEAEKGLKTRNCTRSDCNYSESKNIPILSHTHNFNVESATDKYLTTAATCIKKAKYYYSCSCGEKGTETFEYGEVLNHSFTNYVSDNNATCTEDGTKTAKCDRCNETDTVTVVGSKLGHKFTHYVSDSNATCTEDGTKTAKCDRCNETDTVTDVDSKLGHEFSDYISDNNATCTADGTKTAKCNRCDETDTIADEGSKKNHTFDQMIVDDKYLYSKATYKDPAMYFKSCVCGAFYRSTYYLFSYGEPWDFNDYITHNLTIGLHTLYKSVSVYNYKYVIDVHSFSMKFSSVKISDGYVTTLAITVQINYTLVSAGHVNGASFDKGNPDWVCDIYNKSGTKIASSSLFLGANVGETVEQVLDLTVYSKFSEDSFPLNLVFA